MFIWVAVSCASSLHAEFAVIGKFPAKIVPEQAATLSFQNKGIVSDLILDADRRIDKGTVVAVLDKQKTAEAQEDMELQIARERLTKKDEVRKLETQRKKLKFYLDLSDRERQYAKDMKPDDLEDISPSALADIDERIDLLKRELSTMERRKRAEFETKHEANTLRMPFTGRLQYNISMPEDPSQPFEYAQGPTRPFATVCDDSAFYITLNIADTDLSLLPEENFSASVALPGGRQLRGVFAHRRVERANSGGDMLVYFFRLPEEDHETAYNMLGSNATASLIYTADESVKKVSKATLLAHPAAPECEDWKQLVSIAYPGSVVILIAESDILIRNPKQPGESS